MPGVMVAARGAADISVGCIGVAGPVKTAADRPRSPWRGPARSGVTATSRRSGARGEALWTPVGDQATGKSCSWALGSDGRAPQGWAFQLDPVRAVNDAVEDGVTESGIGDHLMPFADRDLAGDQQRAAFVAVVDDFQQIAALFGSERFRPPIIDDQEPDAFERGHQTRQTSLAAGLGKIAEQAAGALVEDRETVAAKPTTTTW